MQRYGYATIKIINTKLAFNQNPVMDIKWCVMKQVTSFFSDMDVGSGTRALNQSLEMIRLNIRWLQNNENQIEDWLRKHLS